MTKKAPGGAFDILMIV